MVAPYLAPRRLGRVFRVADGAQGRRIEQGPVIQVKDKDRRVWGDGIDFIKRRHTALRELELSPPADDSHPLRRGGACSLLLEQAERVGKRWHSVPTKLHVVVEAAADRMHVRIVKTRDHRSASEIDCFSVGSSQTHNFFVGANADKPPILNGNGFSKRS